MGVPVRASPLLGDLARGPGRSALGLENLLVVPSLVAGGHSVPASGTMFSGSAGA